jgi:poly-gamma-glutamate synthesis protein (capsule biosynthesis protein)
MTEVTLFLCGDVMTGRGVDQVLPHPGDPRLHESYVTSATRYVELAERAHGRVPHPVAYSYVWGDALEELERTQPAARIVNLETSVTRSDDYWRDKGINYRMHPDNVPCLTAARIDCCVLANNHVLDWGYPGLLETLSTLRRAGIQTAGAGRNLEEASAPAVIEIGARRRVVVLGFGTLTSGIPARWAATGERPGVDVLRDLSHDSIQRIRETVRSVKRAGDVVVASLHWGSNWGFAVPDAHIRFAHGLIDAGVDCVHGHSSHHVLPIEVYQGKPILYGCGDFLDDYEGITGDEEFRSDLALMYFPTVDASSGRLLHLRMVALQIRNFRVSRASQADATWLAGTINRESRGFGVLVAVGPRGLELRP